MKKVRVSFIVEMPDTDDGGNPATDEWRMGVAGMNLCESLRSSATRLRISAMDYIKDGMTDADRRMVDAYNAMAKEEEKIISTVQVEMVDEN